MVGTYTDVTLRFGQTSAILVFRQVGLGNSSVPPCSPKCPVPDTTSAFIFSSKATSPAAHAGLFVQGVVLVCTTRGTGIIERLQKIPRLSGN